MTKTLTPKVTDQEEGVERARQYQRAANYIAAAQLYLQANVLLREPLRPEHIKARLLGHWGTVPGINLIYAHLNQLINRHDLDMILVTGPGHGAPANLANLYLEGSLGTYYPELTLDAAGLQSLIKCFSWPGGFPSHLFPGIPGTIHEGGELGYALATAFGAALDNPDLIVACIVGDGEAETGPTATAWHSTKFLDPATAGAVLPIVHINGYKISNPTIYGTMTNAELIDLFHGYGYDPLLIQGEDLDRQMAHTLEAAYQAIRHIQQSARDGQRIERPRWPVILLRSLKGMGGPQALDGKPLEGSYRSHQIPISDPAGNPEHLRALETWLRSYRPEELFDAEGRPQPAILAQCPQGDRRMGSNPHAFGGRIRRPLDLGRWEDFGISIDGTGQDEAHRRGRVMASSIETVARYLKQVFAQNAHNFRIFSPDELESNKLTAVLEATKRDYQWPVAEFDQRYITRDNGQVLEMLSEHTCQAWLQGYLLTGRHGLFPSYEAFLGIIMTMMDQFAKFLKMSAEFPWRLPVSSLNYLETSTLWRQEHNGFSHQSPGFINNILNKKAQVARVYLPPDANCLVSTMDHCLKSTNYVNLIVANKTPMPQWLSPEEATAHCRAGASIWQWASSDDGVDPDVVLVGIGDSPTLEVMAATDILRREVPELRVRVVNVTDLFVLEQSTMHPHGLDRELFAALFTPDRPVIVNFHGYPSAVKQLIFGRPNSDRFIINGYQEEGTTTTPFDINVRNGTSRFHLIVQAIRMAAAINPRVAARASERIHHYEYILADHHHYIETNGRDPEAIANWQWSS